MSAAAGGGRLFAATTSLVFFGFLFGPLVIMVITAFNSSSFPRVIPWECFTTDWFAVLAADDRLMRGLVTSAGIGVGVVALSVPLGLAGALALTEIGPRLRSALYTLLITPILIPGVVLGISTVVFWRSLGRSMGAEYGSFFFNGTFLTIAGQVTFISAYAMLIFGARLQRFDPSLTEAALDLGATPGQAFRKILLPFLKPAIASAAFLTLLASFENYNTTVFTILSGNTFTTALASKVRYGTDPSLSALAVVIIAVTLIGAMTYEAYTRRREAVVTGRIRRSRFYAHPLIRLLTHPAAVGGLLLGLAALAVWQGSRHDSSVCIAGVLEEKRALQERLLEEQRQRLREAAPPASSPGATAPAAAPAATPAPASPSAFGDAFRPGTLGPGSLAPAAPAEPAPPPAQAPRSPSAFGDAFQPGTLGPQPPAQPPR